MKKFAIIGTGLIGGSIAKKLHKTYEIYGVSNAEIKSEIFAKTAIFGSENAINLIKNADIICVATPIFAYHEIFALLSGQNLDSKLVFEVGSVKKMPQKIAKKYNLKINFTHPIAGSDKSGFSSSSTDLFKSKTIILDDANLENVQLEKIAFELGFSKVLQLSCKKHDAIYAKVSHFPQLLSYFFTDFLAMLNLLDFDKELQNLSDNYAKFRRLAQSNKSIWMGKNGIFNANLKNLEKIWNIFKNYMLVNLRGENVIFSDFVGLFPRFLSDNFSEYSNYFGSGIIDFMAFKGEKFLHERLINTAKFLEFLNTKSVLEYAN
ncbi:prephenate dehydrogenase/arogenate dehydrogenase family protein [Candidatus Deianiraea vastatrix]|uniref:Prephenate dehydrogenase n=1 Tax=Candidatus Deianiraea vastatrix TaxID=2163644 RepID=A0A5B8XEG0_9RICK|nr:prephenate dehydrogenase/arogenate dehydrogenase family protein [Candidatus Deianiraea vastatrix]QED23729.1 Prephenate dehydrogenase [Candidatus Deianiraea vastatrix]